MTKEQQHILNEFCVDNFEDLEATHLALLHDIARAKVSDPCLKWLFGYAQIMEQEMIAYKKAQADSTAHA